MFAKILIANRGEIAVRIIRACREMGIASVAVFSEVDRAALHVLEADEAYPIGASEPGESYLRVDRIIDAARNANADAIHPGYGFLAENPELAQACEDSGIVLIGPSAAAMRLMGSKTRAREAAIAAGVPVVPGSTSSVETAEEAVRIAGQFSYPVMIKAAAGGGGKGMRLVREESEMSAAFRDARSEAQNAFADPQLYIEKFIEQPRHIEVQVFGDRHGSVVHMGERECSIQRRHQKVVEECPSPFVDSAMRERMGEAAVRVTRAAAYYNAGTVEFLVDAQRNFHFLEMNTRLQVEHPVTEMVTGLDLVKLQIRIAAGEPLPIQQHEIQFRGHAIECRVYAEDPDNSFFPCPGRIDSLATPSGPGVRDDSGVYEGWTVPVEYDPLISKLAVWGATREEAIERMRRALGEYHVGGIKTNLEFFQRILRYPDFIAGKLDTGLIDRLLQESTSVSEKAGFEQVAALAALLFHERAQMSTRSLNPQPVANRWKESGRRELLRQLPLRGKRPAPDR